MSGAQKSWDGWGSRVPVGASWPASSFTRAGAVNRQREPHRVRLRTLRPAADSTASLLIRSTMVSAGGVVGAILSRNFNAEACGDREHGRQPMR
jgi:hypothetical protein